MNSSVTTAVVVILTAGRAVQLAVFFVQPHYLRTRRLFQSELIVGHLLVEFQLNDRQRNVVLLLRALNLDFGREFDLVVVLVVRVLHLGLQSSVLIVDKLLVRHQISTSENDLAR